MVATVVDVEVAASDEVERVLPGLLDDLEKQIEAALYDYDFQIGDVSSIADGSLVNPDPDFEVDHAEVIEAQLVAAFNLSAAAVEEVQVLSEDALLVTLKCDIDADLDVELEIDGYDADGSRRIMRSATTTTLTASVDATFIRHDPGLAGVTVNRAWT